MPARSGSKGIKNKNFRPFTRDGRSLYQLAVACAEQSGCDLIVASQDLASARYTDTYIRLLRPAELAQDDTPMIAVVRHALAEIPGPPDQIIVLLQPTQPFRTPDHVRKAIALLEESGADSVVSVVELPLTHSPTMVGRIGIDGYLRPWEVFPWWPSRRQDATPAYRRDGTVYAFRRRTVTGYGDLYGVYVVPLVLDPSESCELDTEADWQAVEARWKARHAG